MEDFFGSPDDEEEKARGFIGEVGGGAGGDQGGKLCSMQLHGRHGRGKKEKGENKK